MYNSILKHWKHTVVCFPQNSVLTHMYFNYGNNTEFSWLSSSCSPVGPIGIVVENSQVVGSPYHIFLNISLPAGSDACFMQDFGDGSYALWGPPAHCSVLFPQQYGPRWYQSTLHIVDTGTLILPHVYWSLCRFSMTIHSRNRISYQFNSTDLAATTKPCPMPNVQLRSQYPCAAGVNCDPLWSGVLMHNRSEDLVVAAQVSYQCDITNNAWYSWAIRSFNQSSGNWTNLTDLNSGAYNQLYNGPNVRRVAFTKGTLDYGLHEFCLNVSMNYVCGLLRCLMITP